MLRHSLALAALEGNVHTAEKETAGALEESVKREELACVELQEGGAALRLVVVFLIFLIR
jgi:hypothetical protein